MTDAPDPRTDAPADATSGEDRRRIVVTGAAGTLGSALLGGLAATVPTVEVVAVDRRSVVGPATECHRLDVLVDDLAPVFAGADAVVHLAGTPDVASDDAEGKAAVAGTRRVLAAAGAAGVPLVVRPSATAVYGAWANNPAAITEDATLRPNPGDAAAAADAECERLLAAWARAEPGRAVTRLRFAPVVGGASVSARAEAALGRAPVSVRGAAPVAQVLHVADAAAALVAAARGRLPGVWNVASDGVLDPGRGERGPHVPGCSESAAARALDACWSSGRFGAPGSLVPALVHPLIVDTARIRAVGIVPTRTAAEAAAAAGAPVGRFAATARAAVAVLGAEAGRLRRRGGDRVPSRPIGA